MAGASGEDVYSSIVVVCSDESGSAGETIEACFEPAYISSEDDSTLTALIASCSDDGRIPNANVDLVVVVSVAVPGVAKSAASIDAVGSHCDRFMREDPAY